MFMKFIKILFIFACIFILAFMLYKYQNKNNLQNNNNETGLKINNINLKVNSENKIPNELIKKERNQDLFSWLNPNISLEKRLLDYMNFNVALMYLDMGINLKNLNFKDFIKGKTLEVYDWNNKSAKAKKYIPYFNPRGILSHIIILQWDEQAQIFIPENYLALLKLKSTNHPVFSNSQALELLYKKYPQKNFNPLLKFYLRDGTFAPQYAFSVYEYDKNSELKKNYYFVDAYTGKIISENKIIEINKQIKLQKEKISKLEKDIPILLNNTGEYIVDKNKIKLYPKKKIDEFKIIAIFLNNLKNRGCQISPNWKNEVPTDCLPVGELDKIYFQTEREYHKSQTSEKIDTDEAERIIGEAIENTSL